MDRGAWRATVHGVAKSWTQLRTYHSTLGFENCLCGTVSLVTQMVRNLPAVQKTQVWSLGQEGPLEKRTASYSRNLAWRIPWTEEPGGLQSMGSQRVRHDRVTDTFICCVRWAAKWSFPVLILWNGQIHIKGIWSLPGNFLFTRIINSFWCRREAAYWSWLLKISV